MSIIRNNGLQERKDWLQIGSYRVKYDGWARAPTDSKTIVYCMTVKQ